MLVNGTWTGSWDPIQRKDEAGRFVRQTSSVRNWITQDGCPGPTGRGGFRAEPDRYLLYVALICPWANRTLIARKLKKLEELIQIVVVSPVLSDRGWEFGDFPDATEDPLYHSRYLSQLYTRHEADYTGRATVPVLWDRHTDQMVNNESADIIRMFNQAFKDFAPESQDLYPADLREDIDRLNSDIYEGLNNGVYRAGFAQSQQAYNEAVTDVFTTLDRLETRLASFNPFLLGDSLTESDIRLFVTLIRFDSVYHGLFKCNLRRLTDYPRLRSYLKRIYQISGVAETVNFEHIKTGYYSIRALNPTGIVPLGPATFLVSGN